MTSPATAAALLNTTEAEAASFLAALSFWMAKGCDIRTAIAKHQAVVKHLANNAGKIADALIADNASLSAIYEGLRK